MIRSVPARAVRALPLLLLPMLLAACGDEKAGAAADPAELSARARALGVAPELVYVIEAPGFTVAQQSVGVYGNDGFSSAYWSQKTGAQIHLYVDRGTVTADSCPKQPVGEASGETVTCTRDGKAWYRSSGGQHDYLVPGDGHVIRVVGDTATVKRDILHEAALGAHRPDAAELTALLPSAPAAATEPVERGDLPPVGDGAPNNEVGTSG
ncbi:hypothetical protein OG266_09840 [Streptomyces sp. NBC_00554]|uniref:hypothetical protein n=1 Tax=unclassified Streptomyces TaxID=2593676 RepID=UPI00324D18C6|nr:hypothetical protein OG266_09840 [Streptomyces sp. NBC_00554]